MAVWALLDQAWMPSLLSVVKRLDAVTGPFADVPVAWPPAAACCDASRHLTAW